MTAHVPSGRRRRSGWLAVVSLVVIGPSAGAQTAHPLDALSTAEITATVELLRAAGHVDDGTRYETVRLQPPAKDDVWAWEPGQTPLPRKAFMAVRHRRRVYESVVNLDARRVESWVEIPGVQAAPFDEEYGIAGEAALADARFRAGLTKRGLTAPGETLCEGMGPVGYFGPSPADGRRLQEVQCYLVTGDGNYWAHPVEGLFAIVDVDAREVLEVHDGPVVPLVRSPAGFDSSSVIAQTGRFRDAPRPLEISQPEGPGFRVEGGRVTWDNWRFHLRIDPRVGPVIGTVVYREEERPRNVLYEASLAELFVPYADPGQGWANRTFFDAGEYRLGIRAVELIPNVDCPPNAAFLDAVFASDRGVPETDARAACLFEQRGEGVEWRHFDSFTKTNESRVRRELVFRFVSTIGNYDYLFDWVFRPNGSIVVRVGATGTEEVKGVTSRHRDEDADGRETRHGALIAEHIAGTSHQHLYSFRLDLDVEGGRNSVVEVVPRTAPAEEGPRTSGFVVETRPLRSERDARRPYDIMAAWNVVNPSVRNALGYEVGYQLQPGWNTHPLLAQDDWPRRRSGFADHALWVTAYDPDERHAAGDYITQGPGDGLPVWTEDDEPLENVDLVLWYSTGNTHVVRPEDWPALSTEWVSFELRPVHFFTRTPSLDVHPER